MNQRPWSPISCKCNELNLMTMMLGLCNPISFKKGDKYLITKKKKTLWAKGIWEGIILRCVEKPKKQVCRT